MERQFTEISKNNTVWQGTTKKPIIDNEQSIISKLFITIVNMKMKS